MDWRSAQSNEKPEAVQFLAPNKFLIRRNIVQSKTADKATVYNYEECIAESLEFVLLEALQGFAEKRESEIIDDYTMQLIEGGVI